MAEIPQGESYSAVVAAVAHHQFRSLTAEQWQQLVTPAGVVLDLKGLVPRQLQAVRL
jgi:UDP-N-acetyl-D-galactosamine dehydrogenase